MKQIQKESEYFIVDAHVHTYRSAELGWWGRAIGDDWDPGGTTDELLRYMDEAGISLSIMGNFIPATAMRNTAYQRIPKSLSQTERSQSEQKIEVILRERAERLNRWACSAGRSNPRLIPFIGLDPSFGTDWMVKELEDTVKKHAARGIKIHPGQQWFFPNDRRMWPVYERAQALGVPIQFHSGASGALYVGSQNYAHPQHFADVLTDFPNLSVVLIHFGHYPQDGLAEAQLELALRFKNFCYDIACSWELGLPEYAVELIRKVGIERILWASDWHAHRGLLSLESVKRSPLLTREEKILILGENARRVYRL